MNDIGRIASTYKRWLVRQVDRAEREVRVTLADSAARQREVRRLTIRAQLRAAAERKR